MPSKISALFFDRHDDAARLGIKAISGVGIADLLDRLAHYRRDIDIGGCRDFAEDQTMPVVVAVSQATCASGSRASTASRMASEI